MNIKEKKKNIIQAGYKAVDELIKVAKEKIVETEKALLEGKVVEEEKPKTFSGFAERRSK